MSTHNHNIDNIMVKCAKRVYPDSKHQFTGRYRQACPTSVVGTLDLDLFSSQGVWYSVLLGVCME